nr:coniferyl aldehyde dehydrogenase [Rhizobium sp. Q54]
MNSGPAAALELQAELAAMKTAFATGAPDYLARSDALKRLAAALRVHQEALAKAVDEDFGRRPHAETLLLELFLLHDQIRHARRHLRRWMRRRRVRSTWFLLPSRAFYQYQPLGVVGVIGAWNYPVLLTLGPTIDAIAAGNHVMIKPSELAPRTAAIIGHIVRKAFSAEHVRCVTGDADVGRAFSTLPLDHLFFTGSTRIGHEVMRAAAENLTPVTLELGGKSPAIVHDSYPLARAVSRIMAAKLCNAGQTCVAPDYVLLPAGSEAEFEAQARRAVDALYPGLPENPDYTHIINDKHYARLQALIADARDKGARIVELAEGTAHARLVPPTLIFGVTDAMTIMQEEIFGPLLPVRTYRTLNDAIAYVNERPQPLALYYFDDDRRRQSHVLNSTRSGGVTINDCLYHLGQHHLPFGGVGASGMGHYHGFDGFVTFSKKRPVMLQRRLAATGLLHAPWAPRQWLIETMLRFVSR